MRTKYTICLAMAVVLLIGAGASGAVSWSGPVKDIDGRIGAQYTGPGSKDVQARWRPWTATEKDLLVENLRIHDVWNQKGIDIGCTVNSNGTIWGYENITIRHYEGARINRDESKFPGLHIDFLRIAGGNPQGKGTNVILDDIYIHDGDALPLIVQDGNFGTVRLKNVVLAMFLSGAVAGIAGMTEVAGLQGRLQPGFSGGYGFTAIIVAWLARLNPMATILVSFLLGALLVGGDTLQVVMRLPLASVQVLQGLILFCVLGAEFFRNYRIVPTGREE